MLPSAPVILVDNRDLNRLIVLSDCNIIVLANSHDSARVAAISTAFCRPRPMDIEREHHHVGRAALEISPAGSGLHQRMT